MLGELITPYLPEAAKIDIAEWKAKGKRVFQRVPEQNRNGQTRCRNCGDLGAVYVSFIKAGPFDRVPSSKKPLTYCEGGHLVGKGWYIINRTKGYDCPHCEDGVPIAVEVENGEEVETEYWDD